MGNAPRKLGAMTVLDDPSDVNRAGEWLMPALRGSTEVRSLVPEVFEDYARVFHPASREADERDFPIDAFGESQSGAWVHSGPQGTLCREVSWSDVAQANGKYAHPAMQWTVINGSDEHGSNWTQPGLWERAPQQDSLPLRLTQILCETLSKFTSTPELCYGAVWEGYGSMTGLRSDLELPRLMVPRRPMIAAHGRLSMIPEMPFTDGFRSESRQVQAMGSAERYRSPTIWWPEDHAWFVATDVDMDTTYLGASAACVTSLTTDVRVEAMRVSSDQRITVDSDTLNHPFS